MHGALRVVAARGTSGARYLDAAISPFTHGADWWQRHRDTLRGMSTETASVSRLFQKLRGNATDVSPLNEEWQSVQLPGPSYASWPRIVRVEVVRALQATSLPESRQCVVLLGAQGSGRSTAVQHLIGQTHLTTPQRPGSAANHHKQPPVTTQQHPMKLIEFDFDTTQRSSFVVMLNSFYLSIISQFCRAFATPRGNRSWTSSVHTASLLVADAAQKLQADFFEQFRDFAVAVSRELCPCPFKAEISAAVSASGAARSGFEIWRSVCSRLSKDNASPIVKTTLSAREDPASDTAVHVLPMAAALRALLAFAEFQENVAAYERSRGRVQHFPTGERSLEFLAAALAAFEGGVQAPPKAIYLLKNVEILARSPYHDSRGFPFLSKLLQVLAPSSPALPPLAVTITTDDAITLYKLNDSEYQHTAAIEMSSFFGDPEDGPGEQQPTSSGLPPSPGGAPRVALVTVDPWPKALVSALFTNRVTPVRSTADAVFELVGGQPSLVHILAEEVAAVDMQLRRELADPKAALIQGLRAGRDELVAETPLSSQPSSAQELVDFERERRQQLTVRAAVSTTLAKELLQFQWKINHFLSLPVIEYLRASCQNRALFCVIVLETIRALLDQQNWVFESPSQLHQINHPVVLAVLDARLWTVRLDPPRLEPYSIFYSQLMRGYLAHRFEQLSWMSRAKYNATLLVNRRHILGMLHAMLRGKEHKLTGVLSNDRLQGTEGFPGSGPLR